MVYPLPEPPTDLNEVPDYLFEIKLAIEQIQTDLNGFVSEDIDDVLTFNKFVALETPVRISGTFVYTNRPYRAGKLLPVRDQSVLQPTVDFIEISNNVYQLTSALRGDEAIKHTYLAGD